MLNYQELEPSGKEQMLADLLIQTALRTMSEQPHIVGLGFSAYADGYRKRFCSKESLEDTLLDLTKCTEGGSVAPIASNSSRDHYHHVRRSNFVSVRSDKLRLDRAISSQYL